MTTTGSTTTNATGTATTSTGTTTTGTGSTTSATTTSSTSSTGGGPLPTCMEICAEAVIIAGQLANCPYNQMACEADCAAALAQVGMCQDEFLLFLGCAVDAPATSWACKGGGPVYQGSECDAEAMVFESCVP